MSSIFVGDQINEFISVVNTLGLNDSSSRVSVDSHLGKIYQADSKRLPSDLAAVNKIIASILNNDLSQIPRKTCQQLRGSFSCVIDNYRSFDDKACDEAEQLLANIPTRGKITFTTPQKGTYSIYEPTATVVASAAHALRAEERNATEYVPKLLATPSILDHENEPAGGILQIQNTIARKYFQVDDYNGKYVVAMIGEALTAADAELTQCEDSATLDCAHFCWEWINESLALINGSVDLVSPEHFLQLMQNGWLADTEKNRAMYEEIGDSWPDEEERRVRVYFPDEYEEYFEAIFCDDAIEALIDNYFKKSQEPSVPLATIKD